MKEIEAMAKAKTKGGKSSASIRRGGKVTTFGRARATTGKGGSKDKTR